MLTIRIADSNSDDNIPLHAKNWSDECQEEHRSWQPIPTDCDLNNEKVSKWSCLFKVQWGDIEWHMWASKENPDFDGGYIKLNSIKKIA